MKTLVMWPYDIRNACPTARAYLKQSQITDYPTVTHTTTMKTRTVTNPVKFTRQYGAGKINKFG